MMRNVTISGNGRPGNTRILIDGEPLDSVCSLRLDMAVDDVPRFTAELIVKESAVEVQAVVELYTTINGVRYRLEAIE